MGRRWLTLLAVCTLAVAGCGGGDDGDGAENAAPPAPTSQATPPASGSQRVQVTGFTVNSHLVGRQLAQLVIAPQGRPQPRPLLLLLHGQGGSPANFVTREFVRLVQRLGPRAPLVVLVDGGQSSYYHDRADGQWGSYILREVIPGAVELFGADAGRVAIGGISMGGFGALDLGLIAPRRFCAIGGHSPALYRSTIEASTAAFDGQDDFDRHDVLARVRAADVAPYGKARVWLDVGRDDPFVANASTLAANLRARGQPVTLSISRGGHDPAYWSRNMPRYLRFYADALARC